MGKFTILIILMAIAVVIWINFPAGGGGGSDICKGLKSGDIPNVVNSWTSLGVIRSEDSDEPQIDDKRWQDTPHNAKVSIGVALFCKNHPNSHGSTFLVGYYSGKILASVVDGNYFEQ